MIKTYNYDSYQDINKDAEDLCRQLLNLLYGYDLQDLNKIKRDFPGLDLGDKTKAVGFQVTSTNTKAKLMKTLTTVVKYGHEKAFVNGIKMLILNSEGFNLGKAGKKPSEILASFDSSRDVLVPAHLVEACRELYDNDIARFNQVLALFEKGLNPFYFSGEQESRQPGRPIGTLPYTTGTTAGMVDISPASISDDLSVPDIRPLATRVDLIGRFRTLLDEHCILWLIGEPSVGKTSAAVLIARSSDVPVLWLECRDVAADQVAGQLLMMLVKYLDLPPGKDFGATLNAVFDRLNGDILLILNDLPLLPASIRLLSNIARFLRAAQGKGISVLITSNHSASSDLEAQFDLDMVEVSLPPFTADDTREVLIKYGATEEQVEVFSDPVTTGADGHPLLVHAGARYLRDRGWSVDDNSLRAIFTGRYGADMDRDIYARVLNSTTDAATRDLLYRLSCVVGSFDTEVVQRVAGVQPVIDRVGERMSGLIGIWLQPGTDDALQVSPLIRRLNSSIDRETRKSVYEVLGDGLLARKVISPMEASGAVFYFRQAGQNAKAAIILQQLLVEFMGQPELFFDWGLTIHWYTSAIPDDVPDFIRVQIRALQLEFALKVGRDTALLAEDLRAILDRPEIPQVAQAIGNMTLSHYFATSEPLRAFGHLAAAKRASDAIRLEDIDFEGPAFTRDLLNGIWYVYLQLRSRAAYTEWFRIFRQLGMAVTAEEAYSNNAYRMAGVSIYRNVLSAAAGESRETLDLFDYLIHAAQENGLGLMAAYALKYKIKYLAGELKDIEEAERVLTHHENIWKGDPLMRFLVFAEMAIWLHYAGEVGRARTYLDAIADVAVPETYTEGLDYLILQSQAVYAEDKARSARYSRQALTLALSGDYLLIDKIKLYGEAATGELLLGRWASALELYADGYQTLLDHFVNDEEQQAQVIRYGSALNYLTQMINDGQAPKYDSGEFVIPEPGHFYKTNDALLAGSFYFDERRFFGAMMIEGGYEGLGDWENTRYWAGRSIDLSLSMEDLRYGIMIMKMVFFPVRDEEYRRAYSLLQYLENWIRETRKRVVSEGESSDVIGMFTAVDGSDVTLYHLLLIPATFTVSLDILHARLSEDHYQRKIDELFDRGSYVLQEPEAYVFARSLYEAILLDRIDYQSVEGRFEQYHGPQVQSLRVIAYVLLATFASAREAANLHLAIIKPLDMSTRMFRSAYRFGMVPYFVEFWRWMAEGRPGGISTIDHMKSAGWGLVSKAPWDKKLPKVFQVVTHHLNIEPTGLAEEFIEGR